MADVDKKLAKRFDILNLIGMFKRTTFIISEDQKIIKKFPKVKVNGHVDRVIEYLKELDK